MPLPNFANALNQQKNETDSDKRALYPRQAKTENPIEDASKKKKKGFTPNLLDLLKADANSGESKLAGSSAFAAALAAPPKPGANVGDVLSYWQNVTKVAQAERQSVTARFNSVLKSVNLQGFRQASKAKTWKAKVFWIILLVFIICVMTFEIKKCVYAYNNSPVTTKFTITTPPAMDFPNVYICYGSAINRTFMLQNKDLMAVATAYRNRDAVTKSSKKNKRSAIELSDDEISAILRMHDEPIDDEDENRNAFHGEDDGLDEFETINVRAGLRSRRQANMNLTDAALRANRTKAEQAAAAKATQMRIQAMLQAPNISDVIYQYYEDAGFKLDETFLECSFHGYTKQKLNCRDIVRPVIDANYFLCYVVDLPDQMKQTVAGKGLSLVLNSNINLYPKTPEESPPLYGGIVISVEKEYNPFNWEKTCVTAGRITKIDLSMTHVHLENFESGALIQHCLAPDQTQGAFQIFKANYSRTACQMDCLFQAHRNNCDCLMLVDRTQLRDEILNTTKFCSPSKFADCVAKLPSNDEAQKGVNACLAHCISPCESYRYDMRASYAKLHEPSYARFKLPPNVTAKQLIDLHVAFSRLEYAELIQKPSASFADLVANTGGQINLWMGASLISMVEMFFMGMGFMIWSCYIKIFKGTPMKKNENTAGGQQGKV